MGHSTTFQDSILVESTYGTSVITTAATATYLPGAISQKATHPNPRYSARYAPVAVGQREVGVGGVWKADAVRSGMWTLVMQNGWPLWFIMGSSSTTGAGPYIHTLTPGTLPSFTMHHERTGSATDMARQYTGCILSNLKVLWDDKVPSLTGVLDWVAQDAADPNLDGSNAMLSTTPVVVPTSTQGPYTSISTATFDGTNIDNLSSFELGINPGLTALTARWIESGADMSHVPLAYVENLRRTYTMQLLLHPANDDLWDESIAHGNTKDIVFKFQKSATDYIQFTCSDVQALWHESASPVTGKGDELLEQVDIEFRALSIEISDSIVASFYGE